jgi:hypothetical protein
MSSEMEYFITLICFEKLNNMQRWFTYRWQNSAKSLDNFISIEFPRERIAVLLFSNYMSNDLLLILILGLTVRQ